MHGLREPLDSSPPRRSCSYGSGPFGVMRTTPPATTSTTAAATATNFHPTMSRLRRGGRRRGRRVMIASATNGRPSDGDRQSWSLRKVEPGRRATSERGRARGSGRSGEVSATTGREGPVHTTEGWGLEEARRLVKVLTVVQMLRVVTYRSLSAEQLRHPNRTMSRLPSRDHRRHRRAAADTARRGHCIDRGRKGPVYDGRMRRFQDDARRVSSGSRSDPQGTQARARAMRESRPSSGVIARTTVSSSTASNRAMPGCRAAASGPTTQVSRAVAPIRVRWSW